MQNESDFEDMAGSRAGRAPARRTRVLQELGKDFIASDAVEEAPSDKQKKTKTKQ